MDSRATYQFGRHLANYVTDNLVDVRVKGVIPDGPAIIAPNHKSDADLLLIGHLTEKTVFYVAKKELFDTPLKSAIMTGVNSLIIDRENPTRQQIATYVDVLTSGHLLTIFPEGTRVKGPELGEIKDLVAFLSYGKNIPVIPVGIVGSAQAQQHVIDNWYNVRALLDRPIVEYRVGEPIFNPRVSRDKKKDFANFNQKLKESLENLIA